MTKRIRTRWLIALTLFTFVVSAGLPGSSAFAANESVSVWLTTRDRTNLLRQQGNVTFGADGAFNANTIDVDENVTFQQIEGFGIALNGSTVYQLQNKMNASQRDVWMTAMFNPTSGIGINMLRQPIGGSDLNPVGEESPFSYCSYNDGATDPNLTNFSIQHDVNSGVIDRIRQARGINPNLKVLASVWCIPRWMQQTYGGYNNGYVLNPTYYGSFSNYLVKFIQAYNGQGVPIWGITPQNEPLGSYANYGNSLTAEQERDLIKNNLGPAIKNNADANVRSTKILVFDHNWDAPEYPETIFADAAAAGYTDGSAWHWYGGAASAQTRVRDNYPSKGIYFTEDSSPRNNVNYTDADIVQPGNIPFRALRNWSRTYIRWTAALNTNYGPSQCGGCGALSYIDDATGNVTYAQDYYITGHFSKYVQLGASRVWSTETGQESLNASVINNVAFKNPDGSKVLVVFNGTGSTQSIKVRWGNQAFTYSLPAKAFATFKWSGTQSGGMPNLLANPSFQADSATQTPSGWSESGTTNTSYTETYGSRDGTLHLTHYAGSTYEVYTYQTKTGLTNGLYTIRAWVKGGKSGTTHQLEVKDYGGWQVNIPVVANEWTYVSASNINVTNGQAIVGIYSKDPGGTGLYVDDIQFYKQ